MRLTKLFRACRRRLRPCHSPHSSGYAPNQLRQCAHRKLGVFAIRFSMNFAIGFADSPAFAWLAKRPISQQRKAFRSSFAVVTFLKRSLTALRMAHTRRIPSPLPSELKCELEDAFDRPATTLLRSTVMKQLWEAQESLHPILQKLDCRCQCFKHHVRHGGARV